MIVPTNRNEKGQFIVGIKHQLGFRHSEETKKKLSEGQIRDYKSGKRIHGRIGTTHSVETRKHWSELRKGRKWSEETRKKIMENLKLKSRVSLRENNKCLTCSKVISFYAKFCREHYKRTFVPPSLRGELSHNWKGGLTQINQRDRALQNYINWRNAVFLRDGFTCQKYKTIGGKIVAHHIRNWSNNSDVRFDIDNGITLSQRAHKEFHKRFGNKNTTREQLNCFLYEIHNS